jgi:hypothetical protein
MEQTITATDFANRLNVSVNQVYRWADAGLIPGAVTASGTLRIPAAARRPYVSRSRRKQDIYGLIVYAVLKDCQVLKNSFPHLNLTDREFSGYLDDLTAHQLIRPRSEGGVTYYDATVLSAGWDGLHYRSVMKKVDDILMTLVETGIKTLK